MRLRQEMLPDAGEWVGRCGTEKQYLPNAAASGDASRRRGVGRQMRNLKAVSAEPVPEGSPDAAASGDASRRRGMGRQMRNLK